MNVSGVSGQRLKDFSFDLYTNADQRAYVTQDGLTAIAALDRTVARLSAAPDQACVDAVKNLARYKFSNFGYHAARWVTLNAILGDKQANPFKPFVDLARLLVTAPVLDAGATPIGEGVTGSAPLSSSKGRG